MRPIFKLFAIVGGSVLAACGWGDASQPKEHAHAKLRHVEIVAKEMSFGPSEVRLRAGQRVRLHFVNKGAVLHDLNAKGIRTKQSGDAHGEEHGALHAGHEGHQHSVAGGQLHVMAPAGGRADIEFEAPQPGEYEYFCSVPGHRAAGMVGRILVH